MREWKFYITGSIYADTLGETTADIEDAKAIGRCFVIKSNGNAAKMRDALSDACYAMFNFLKTQNGGYGEMAKALDKAKAALAEPPRNCDRPECATTKAAQDVWSREDGGKTAYYEWLLATYTEGGTIYGKKH